MANVIFKKGLLANLPSTKTAGAFYVTTDERAIYLDVDSSTRIRLGDFQEFSTIAELEANTNPSTTALYYVSNVNCLAKWDGTNYIKINPDTGATGVEVHETSGTPDSGNVVTNITYDPATRKLILYKGITAAELGDSSDVSSAITLYGVKAYATEQAAAVLGSNTDTSSANTVYGAKALANEKVASITAGGGIEVSTSSPNSATAPSVGIKLSAKSGNELTIETGAGEEGLYFKSAAAQTVSVVEKATPNTGYLKSYQVTVDGTAVGVDIDIPKDFLVKSGEVKTVTVADEPYEGAQVGDKYIDFVVNVKSGTATDEHIYLPVNELVDAYNAGNGLELGANNTFAVKLDSTSVGGLTVSSSGLKLAEATPDVYTSGTKTADGVAGAMSSADKYKLNGIAAGAEVNVLEGVQVDGIDLTIDGNKKVNLVCNTAYNASTNKIATMSDVSAAALEWGSF